MVDLWYWEAFGESHIAKATSGVANRFSFQGPTAGSDFWLAPVHGLLSGLIQPENFLCLHRDYYRNM